MANLKLNVNFVKAPTPQVKSNQVPSAVRVAILGLLGAAAGAGFASKSGKAKAIGVASGAGISLMILAMTWPKSKMA